MSKGRFSDSASVWAVTRSERRASSENAQRGSRSAAPREKAADCRTRSRQHSAVFAGVMTMARMKRKSKQHESSCMVKRQTSTGNPRGPGRAVQEVGEVRSSEEVG